MPIYEYQCVEDQSLFEERVFFPGEEVPDSITVEEQIYKKLPPIPSKARFKGSGFYETDYK